MHDVHYRVEGYSCKMTGADKKLLKTLNESAPQSNSSLQALSPPKSMMSRSPSRCDCAKRAINTSPQQQQQLLSFLSLIRTYSRSYGQSLSEEESYLCLAISTKTLFYLISTLNASFPPRGFTMLRKKYVDWMVVLVG